MSQHTFYQNGVTNASEGVRLAPPRLDFRWEYFAEDALAPDEAMRLYPQEPFSPEVLDEEDDTVYIHEPLGTEPPHPPTPPEDERPMHPPSEPVTPAAGPEDHLPQITLLEIAQMYKDEWRLVRVETSATKSYAFLLPRNCKLSLKQAIKRRKALVITMDSNGRLSIQDLRKTPPKGKDAWWKNIFGWL